MLDGSSAPDATVDASVLFGTIHCVQLMGSPGIGGSLPPLDPARAPCTSHPHLMSCTALQVSAFLLAKHVESRTANGYFPLSPSSLVAQT